MKAPPAILRRLASLLALAALLCAVPLASARATHTVEVTAEGFRPAALAIRAGDTVLWRLSSRQQSVVAATGAAAAPNQCPAPRAWTPNDRAAFAGPNPFAPSGIYSLAPLEDRGLSLVNGACPGGRGRAVGGQSICPNGPALTSMENTWADPNNTGVFIRLLWNRLQIAPGTDDASFDFRDLDREIDQAVRHGKLYSLSIKAGQDGTPDWIFRSGVTPLALQDGGSDNERAGLTACGPRMTLGSPTDPAFERHFFAMLSKVAARIRARADRYRALAYIKASGANLFSHENRLPKRCTPGCICNTQVFAEHGYTPSKLYGFYKRQFELLKKEFPGKAISYQLIQDGFPSVNDSGGYERADGSSSNGRPVPGGVEQTERILEIGQSDLGSLFVVQHNGLQVYRGECADRPAQGRRGGRAVIQANRGLGCPNRWVLQAGADGKTITGFQTQNLSDIVTPADVDLALRNAWVNSDGVFVELYEAPLWYASKNNRGVLPSGRTLAQWADDFHQRRRTKYAPMGDPFPRVFQHTFSGVSPGAITYFDPATCRSGTLTIGK